MEPPPEAPCAPGAGGSAPSTRGWGRSQVSEIWILVTAAYKQRSVAPRQAAGRGLGRGLGQQLGPAALGVDDQRRMLA